jgi:phosphohistidine phosphatase SixA
VGGTLARMTTHAVTGSGAERSTVLLVRHAEAGDRERWEGDDRERPLSRAGRRQSERLVEALRDQPVRRILSSPYVRCVETVEPLAAARGLPVEPTDALAEGAGAASVRRLLGEVGDAVLCSHGDVVEEVVEDLGRRGVAVDGGIAKGSTWVLDVVGGEVVGARYLPEPA